MDPYVGEIRVVGFNFAPRGWALCNGALLSIQQNTALFSLLGITYGGDGRSTFGLPNLQGNIAVAAGQLPGGSSYPLGSVGGTASVTLTAQQMPAHVHTLPCTTSTATPAGAPSPSVILGGAGSRSTPGQPFYVTAATQSSNPATMAAPQLAGGGAAHNNMAPYVAMYYVIALLGIYPSRP